MNGSFFIHPKDYFAKGLVWGNQINPDLLGKYAKSTAKGLIKTATPLNVIESAYGELASFYQSEKNYTNVQDISDIMRSRIYSEPYIYFKFLVHFIDSGLLNVENELEMDAFFIHFQRVIELYKNSNQGMVEF